jgi:hypothetical protein
MLRTAIAVTVGLVFLAALARADEKKLAPPDENKPDKPRKEKPGSQDEERGRQVMGTIKKVDAEKGMLTVTTEQGGKAKDVTFKITDKTKLRNAGGTDLKGGLKSDRLKAGTRVTVYSNEGAVLAVELATGRSPIEELGKFEQASGIVKNVDAEKGMLTVAVRRGNQTKDEEFQVGDKTHFLGRDGKQLKGGLKEQALKPGTQVTVFVEGGTARAVQIGGRSSPIETAGQFEQAMGTITKVNTGKHLLTVDVRRGRRMGKVDFKITDKTRFLGADGKPLKEGLKADSVKEGSQVIVFARDGVAEAVRVGR